MLTRIIKNAFIVILTIILISKYGYENGVLSLSRFLIVSACILVLYFVTDISLHYIKHSLKVSRNKKMIKIIKEIKEDISDERK